MGKYDVHCYDDIIDSEYTGSRFHRHMTMQERAAQFAPFAALSGHKEAVEEMQQERVDKVQLSQEMIDEMNSMMTMLKEKLKEKKITVRILYFEKDTEKKGGSYKEKISEIKKFDEIEGSVVFADRSKVMLRDIKEISEYLFKLDDK